MHTAMMIGIGVVLLAVFILIGHITSGGWSVTRIRAAGWFLPFWFLVALGNLWVGVAHAGHGIGVELPIMALVFGVPAAASAAVMWITCQQ